MTQFVNGTDEAIVLEPGEGISGDSELMAVQDSVYRLRLTRVTQGPKPEDEFSDARDILDAERRRRKRLRGDTDDD